MLVLVGPTGVGKSEVAVTLAERLHCPILNADSRQIYHEIPIGTAAPTAEQRKRVQHYFVGTHKLNEDYNAGQFERDALDILSTIHNPQSTKVLAILTGGSMMYIDAVCNGLDEIPAVPQDIRKAVQDNYRTQGLTWLQQEVQRLDPDYWQIVDQSNPQRLMHCVEVSQTIGKPYSSLRKQTVKERPWRIVKVGLTRPRAELYERINKRVDEMIAAGLEQEARAAFAKYPDRPNGLQTVGYREWNDHRTPDTKHRTPDTIKQNTRHYAKRQMTWWRRDNTIHWIDNEETNHSVDAIIDYVHQLQERND